MRCHMWRSPNHSALSDTSVICCAGQCPVTPPPTKLLYSPLGSLVEEKCVESELGVTSRLHCPDGAAPGSVVGAVGAPGAGAGGGAVGCCAASGAASANGASSAISEKRMRLLIAGSAAPAAAAA